MISDFSELARQLKIDLSFPSQEGLEALKLWYEQTVSSELHIEGTMQTRFKLYQQAATTFLEEIQPYIQTNHLTTPVPEFNGMTSLQYIVVQGFDVYLKNLQPNTEQILTKTHGNTLLHLAAALGHVHVTRALLALGASLNETNANNESALFSALLLPVAYDSQLKKNKEVVFALLSHDLDTLSTVKNQSGDTLLHLMAVHGYDQLIEKTLRGHDSSLVFISNNSCHYPIHSAILNAQHPCARLLLAVKEGEQLADAKGRNALHYAAKYGDDAMMQICLNSPIDKDSLDKQKQTPLMLAAMANNANAVTQLMDCGADMNKTDDFNKNALHYAIESDAIDCIKLLASNDTNLGP